jgi:uncharacterized protein (TIGR02117 family)
MKLIVVLLGLVVIYLSLAVLLSVLPTHPKQLNCNTDKQIYITTNGVHLDIILPRQSVDSELLNQLIITSNIRFVSFGWGDKQFYLNTPEWSDLTFPVALQALFLRSESAMHVTPYQNSYESWNKLKICNEQLNTLNEYIVDSFEKEDLGEIKKIDVSGYGYNDYFYEANKSFTVFMFLVLNVDNE